MGSDGIYRSAWKYADEIGKHNLILLERYHTNSFYLSFANAGETHLIYMRPTFYALRALYKMASPFYFDSEIKEAEEQFKELRVEMEEYLSKLARGQIDPNYSILIKFDVLEMEILKKMNKAGLLYASEKVISESEQVKTAYGTNKPRSKKYEI